MAGFLVHGQEKKAPVRLSVQRRMGRGDSLRQKDRSPTSMVTELIVHETVTSTARAAVDVLQRRGLGVHLVIGTDGAVYQHADLIDDECRHAVGFDATSIGLEIVNPYYPSQRPNNSPWTTTIVAPWADRGMYVVPTPDQAEATSQVIEWATSSESGLSIPRQWVGVVNEKMLLTHQVPVALGPGIYAHHYFGRSPHYFGHLDGLWPVLYAWLRIEAGLDMVAAYAEAVRLTTNAQDEIDLSPLFPRGQVPSGSQP